jgi:hypothetical protein
VDVRNVVRGLLACALLVAAACGEEPEGAAGGSGAAKPSAFETPFTDAAVYPRFVSSQLAVGENRFLVGLLNDEDAPVGAPDIAMHVSFFDLERSTTEPVMETDMRWVWITRPYVGLYASTVEFESAGEWGAEVSVSGRDVDETVRASFTVSEETSTPAIGERAPSSKTPVASGAAAIRRISTDTRPDPRFYDTSVAEAIRGHEPFVVVFATPKFCATQACGPLLDIVKSVAPEFREVTFIHVEPYELPADPAALRPVRAATEWGLPTEPWAFVVDAQGRVAAKFEGALARAELEEELERLS